MDHNADVVFTRVVVLPGRSLCRRAKGEVVAACHSSRGIREWHDDEPGAASLYRGFVPASAERLVDGVGWIADQGCPGFVIAGGR